MTADQNFALKAIHSILKQKKKQPSTVNIQKTILKTLIDLDDSKKHAEALPFLELLTEPIDSSLKNDFIKIGTRYLHANKQKPIWINIFSKNFSQVTLDEFLFICQTNLKDLQFIIRNNFGLYKNVPNNYRHVLLGFICDNITFIEGFGLDAILDYMYSEKILENENSKMQFCKFLWLYTNHKTKKEYQKNAFDKLILILEEVCTYGNFNIYLLKIIAKLLQVNYYYASRNTNGMFTLSEKLVDKINGNLELNNETVAIYRDVLTFGYKYYEAIVTKFVLSVMHAYKDNKSNAAYDILISFSKNFGLTEFCEIIQKNSIDHEDFLEIYKKGCNIDLFIFVQLYGDLKNVEDAFSVFSSFTKFCTDKNNQFPGIANILIDEASRDNIKTLKFIANGIINIISSYLRYNDKNVVLHNEIGENDIESIFATIIEKDFFTIFFDAYKKYGDAIFQEAVQMILRIQEIDNTIVESIQRVILTFEEGVNVDLSQVKYIENCCGIPEILKIARLFIPRLKESSAFTAKILSFLITQNNVLQKIGYSFLHDMIIYGKTGVCICDTIIAEDYSVYYTCAIRYRLLTLFGLYNNCKLCNKTKAAFFTKIIYELILNAKSNSAKARKISEDIMSSNINDSNYKEFIKVIVAGLNTDNYKIINGAIKCLIFLLTNKKEYIAKNIELVVSQAKKLQNKGKEVQKSVIELYKTMILELDCIDSEEYLEYIGRYANTRSKVDNAIKRAGRELQGRTRLTKAVDNIIHKKYKGQNKLNLSVSKKGVVELGYKKTFDSDTE